MAPRVRQFGSITEARLLGLTQGCPEGFLRSVSQGAKPVNSARGAWISRHAMGSPAPFYRKASGVSAPIMPHGPLLGLLSFLG